MIVAFKDRAVLVRGVNAVNAKVAHLVLAPTTHAKVPAFYPRVVTQCRVRRFYFQQRRNGMKSPTLVDLDSCNFTGKSERHDDYPWWLRGGYDR